MNVGETEEGVCKSVSVSVIVSVIVSGVSREVIGTR
jgi:hypothetical protein